MRFSLILEVCVSTNWMELLCLWQSPMFVELPTLSPPVLSGDAAEAAASLQEALAQTSSSCEATPTGIRAAKPARTIESGFSFIKTLDCHLWCKIMMRPSFKMALHTKSAIERTHSVGKITLPCCCLNKVKIWANVDKASIRRTQKPQQTRRSCCVSRWWLTCSPGNLHPRIRNIQE